MTGSVLDIGAADRWIEPHLPASAHYIALDYPATGRDLYGGHPHVFADARSLPFADASMDGVLCLEVLEHVSDPAWVVAESARVAKPGGSVWLSMPFLYPIHDAPYDFQRYSRYGLQRDLNRAGLEVVSLRRRSNAVAAAGLLACLAIAGGALNAPRGWRILLLPVAAVGVLMVNLCAWLLSKVWPDWDAMTDGYEIEARKP